MPNTTSYSFADIVPVRFPFADQRGSKQRPAVVISSDGYNEARPDVVLMAITSQLRQPPAFGEARISDWQVAGLLKESAIKPVIFTAETAIVTKRLGRLQDGDRERLKAVVKMVVVV